MQPPPPGPREASPNKPSRHPPLIPAPQSSPSTGTCDAPPRCAGACSPPGVRCRRAEGDWVCRLSLPIAARGPIGLPQPRRWLRSVVEPLPVGVWGRRWMAMQIGWPTPLGGREARLIECTGPIQPVPCRACHALAVGRRKWLDEHAPLATARICMAPRQPARTFLITSPSAAVPGHSTGFFARDAGGRLCSLHVRARDPWGGAIPDSGTAGWCICLGRTGALARLRYNCPIASPTRHSRRIGKDRSACDREPPACSSSPLSHWQRWRATSAAHPKAVRLPRKPR